jgi:hypothetical protein
MFERLWTDYAGLIQFLSKQIEHSKDRTTTQDLVNTIYEIYTSLLNTCCEKTLGTYQPQQKQQNIDNSIPFLRSSMAHDHAVRLFKRSQRGKQQQLVSDDPTLSPMDSATKFYATLYNPPNSNRFYSTLYTRQNHPLPSNPLTPFCTPTKISQHIMKYPSTKTFGLDTLHIRIFKSLSSSTHFLSSMQLLFTTFISSTHTPSAWNVSQITPIPKKMDSFTPSSSRPISLTPCLRRIFESLILSFIYSQPTLNEFSPFQAGFRTGYTTVTHLWLSHASAHFPIRPRNIHIFLDLEKAYDRVPIARLLDKLKLRDTPDALIQLVDSLFSSCSSQMIVNHSIGPIFSRSVGLFQGSILSPWLFNVYIDDLAKNLARIDPHPILPPILLFADDIKLQPSTPNIAIRMLSIVQTWSIHNGININVNKSAVIESPSSQSLQLKLNGIPLPLVPSYDYLGMPYTAKGLDFPSFVATITRRTQKIFFASTRYSRGWSPYIRLILFKTFFRSTYEYALPLLYASNTPVTSIQKFQNTMLQWICQGHRGHELNHTLSGVSPISSRIQELTMRFQAKLLSLHADNPIHILKKALVSNEYSTRLQRQLLFPLIPPTKLHQEYLQLSNMRPPWDPLTFTEFIRNCKLQTYATTKNILPRSILPEARDNTLVDISLRIRNPKIQSFAIRWRLNRLLAHYKCKCGDKLTRGHVTRCYDFSNVPETQHLPPMPQTLPSPHYNPVDHALNFQKVRIFLTLLHFITQHEDFLFDFRPP